MLLTPDSFPHDWYGWVTNQSGHFLLGVVVAFLFGRIWPAVAVAVAFELIQWSPDWIDSITDIAFTFAGAVFFVYSGGAVLYAIIAAMMAGVWQRCKNDKV